MKAVLKLADEELKLIKPDIGEVLVSGNFDNFFMDNIIESLDLRPIKPDQPKYYPNN